MLKVTEDIVSIESFQVKLEPAMRAQAVIFRWGGDNEQTFGCFETVIRAELQKCINRDPVQTKLLGIETQT